MGRFKVGAEVHDNDGFEGVIVGKPKKGWRDVAYQFGTVRVRKGELNFDRAGRAPKVCVEVCETEYKVGDRVRLIRDNTNGGPEYGAKGEEFEVTSLGGGWGESDEIRIKHSGHGFDPAVSVRDIEPVVAPATTAEWTPKVGDRVRMVKKVDGEITDCPATIKFDDGDSSINLAIEFDSAQGWAHSAGDFTMPNRGWWVSASDIEPLPVATQPAGFRVGGLGSYTTRDGRKALVEGEWGLTGSDYRWSGQIDGGEYGLLWKEDGTNYDGPDSPLDLIAEWPADDAAAPVAEAGATATPFALEAGKFYETATGKRSGPMRIWATDVKHPFEDENGYIYRPDGTSQYGGATLVKESPAALVEVAEATATPLFKKGDLLECVDGDHEHLTLGKEYEAQRDAYGKFVQVKMDNGNTGGMYLTRFRLATPPAKFKVGDRVVYKNDDLYDGRPCFGTVDRIEGGNIYASDWSEGGSWGFIPESDLRLATTPPLTIGTTVTLSARITGLTSDTASLSINGANVNLPASALLAA